MLGSDLAAATNSHAVMFSNSSMSMSATDSKTDVQMSNGIPFSVSEITDISVCVRERFQRCFEHGQI